MRLIKALLAFLFIVAGIVFGALNRQPVRIDFGFGVFELSLGTSLLLAVLFGAVLAGVVLGTSILLSRREPAQPAKPGNADATVPTSHE